MEGAALGMSLLESFAKSGALLTIATTHHGELKTLKFSNEAFENACVEFDEENLKPAYKILWGVPGRSNAINIAERLGLPGTIVDDARELYGSASAQIDEVIIDMECIKKNCEELLEKTRNLLMDSRNLYEKMLLARRRIIKYGREQRLRKMLEVSEAATMARSDLHRKVRQLRASAIKSSQPTATHSRQHASISISNNKLATEGGRKNPMASRRIGNIKQPPSEKPKFPKVGDSVYVSAFGKGATVLIAEPSKDEIVVQVGSIKMKLRFADIMT